MHKADLEFLHSTVCLFTYLSLNTYLLRVCHIPDTVQGTGKIVVTIRYSLEVKDEGFPGRK